MGLNIMLGYFTSKTSLRYIGAAESPRLYSDAVEHPAMLAAFESRENGYIWRLKSHEDEFLAESQSRFQGVANSLFDSMGETERFFPETIEDRETRNKYRIASLFNWLALAIGDVRSLRKQGFPATLYAA